MLKWFRSWLWARRNMRMSRGTRIAMEHGNRMAAKRKPSPKLVAAIRMALENERKSSC